MEKKTEKVRQFYTALAQGDFETVGALLSDDLVWHQPGEGGFVGRLQRQAERFRPFGKDGSTEQWHIRHRSSGLRD